MKPNANNNDTIDLLELFFVLLSHWKKILISIVLVAAIAFGYSKVLVTPMYASTARLYVLSSSTSITSLADIQIGSNLANDYMEVVSSRPVLDQVIVNLGLNENYSSLKGRLSINNPTNSRMLDITVEDPSPKQAKVIADEIAEVSAAFISEKMNQDPPNIVQYGYVAESPVSPDVKKNTALGGLVGAVLSIIIIAVAYLLNDTIMTPEDIENRIGLNVLASIPKDEEDYNGSNKKSKRGKQEKQRREPQKKTASGSKKSKQA
ncbi:MAG: YveK family protein [Agathobacter sp.]